MAITLGRRIAVLVVTTLMALMMVAVSPAAWAANGGNGNHYGQAKEHSNNGHHNGHGSGPGGF
jgi:hypothetical protein